MWLSEKLAETAASQTAQPGKVTLSQGNTFEAEAAVRSRNVRQCAPYGYCVNTPAGASVMLLPSSDGQLALGINRAPGDLEAGEIRIVSRGGASIVLKNDGSVVINNHFIINKDGESLDRQ